MNNDKIFVDGLIAKRNDRAPDFVLCSLSFKVDEIKAWLDTHNKNGWVNVSVKRGQSGKVYAELDTWEPQNSQPQQQPAPAFEPPPMPGNLTEVPESEIPF